MRNEGERQVSVVVAFPRAPASFGERADLDSVMHWFARSVRHGVSGRQGYSIIRGCVDIASVATDDSVE